MKPIRRFSIVFLLLVACLDIGCSRNDGRFSGQAVIDVFQLTQVQSGEYEFEDGIGTIIKVDLNKSEIFFTQCPRPPSESINLEEMSSLGQQRDLFLETALPTWKGTSLSFIQIWNSLEHSTVKEVTMPYNGLIIRVNTWIEGCRSMTISCQ